MSPLHVPAFLATGPDPDFESLVWVYAGILKKTVPAGTRIVPKIRDVMYRKSQRDLAKHIVQGIEVRAKRPVASSDRGTRTRVI